MDVNVLMGHAPARVDDKGRLKIPSEFRKLIEEMMIQRMGENDKIVTRYMDDPEFRNSAFPILAREILEAIRRGQAAVAAPK